MSKQSLLLVDGDTRSLRVLEVSLRKAGFTVTPADSVKDALDKLELHAPDLIISETIFPEGDGFDLRRRVRASPDWAEIPFVFLTASSAIENKIRGLELGVDDYLTKPIYIKEIVTRINILLQKRQRARFEERRDGRTRFAGRVTDMPVVDVIQTIEISRKSGVIQFTGDGGRQGAIYFRDGKVIDAEADALAGEDAVYRLLTWSDGEFEVVFRTVRRRDAITTSSQGLLMEGMRRLDEWTRLLEQLPPLTHRFEVDTAELVTRLGEVPDDNNLILRLIDGKRTLHEVIDASEFGDLECLQAISRLFFEGLLLDLDHGAPIKRTTGQPMPLVQIEDSSPFQSLPDVANLGEPPPDSGPVATAEAPPPAEAPSPSSPSSPSLEDDVAQHALLGGYRPSSLMLIDAAVAAAQLIEPSLFEGGEAPGALETARREAAARIAAQREAQDLADANADAEISVSASAEDSVPRSIGPDLDRTPIPGEPRERSSLDPEDPTPRPGALSPRAIPAARREDSGLRMIGSLGRDRAEASGEVVPPGGDGAPSGSTQRELVTILPRRATRDLPMHDLEPPPLPPSGEASDPDEFDEPGDYARSAGPLPALDDRDRELDEGETLVPRGARGPSLMTIGLLVLAVLLAAMAIYMQLDRHKGAVAPAVQMNVVPGPQLQSPEPVAPAVAPAAPLDAAVAAVTVPPATASPDALPPAEAPPDPAAAMSARMVESSKHARLLMDQSGDAIRNAKYDDAISLADQSLRLHRTARTYLLKATALQKLDRIDEALVAVDEAISLAASWPPAWEQRGRMLWSAKRYDEARVAFDRYLQLEPTGPTVPQIKHMLAEPR